MPLRRSTAVSALTSLTAEAGCLPCQQRQNAAAAVRLAPEVADPPSTNATWSGVIGMEGELTGDGRLIELNALRWEELPLPLRYVSSDVGAHDGAQVVGRITSITRGQGGTIEAIGDFDTSSVVGLEAMRQVGEGLTTGVSMDLDDVSFEIRVAADYFDAGDPLLAMLMGEDEEGEEMPTDDEGRIVVAEMKPDDEISVTTSGRLRAATIVAIPAFASAQIHLTGDPAPVEGLAAAATFADEPVSDKPWSDFTQADYNEDQWFRATALHKNGDSRTKSDNGLPIREPDGTLNRNGVHNAASRFNQVEAPAEAKSAAAATLRGAYDTLGEEPPDSIANAAAESLVAGGIPLAPPQSWFDDPHFTSHHPLKILDTGQVFGHLAEWGVCHISHTAPGQCTTAPNSASDYAYFHTGSIVTAEGSEIAIGHITLDTNHAGETLTPARASAHYENTGTVVADVVAGEDAYGIWVAGALRPSVTPEQIRAMRAAPLSGDWRRIGYALELVAALSVNVPGFGIPRPRGLVAGGVVTSLVAAGMLPPRKVLRPGTEGALSLDDLRYLKRLADRERREEQTLLASGRLDAATNLARRVRASTLAMRAHRPMTTTSQGGQ
jgi:hypothetical protein